MTERPQEEPDITAMRAARGPDAAHYELNLYVTGMTPRSARAIENLRAFCARHLQGRHTLRIIDIYQQPALARAEQLVAAPTLVRRMPLPQRRLIGDLSDQERMLEALDIPS
ncbi:MAG TPA: circadian clock KaiB family protein [Steroidobacteraceae bacterium]|nr:circadian clock KaiB family protein [Steroidobacteraceae bacterium]